ncbi:hypothetical protein QFZ56_004165 [Streptomyces achromogenes]|uniref:Uncharacterized protein n=1 Tax=Streptomyces achromogenes TaxID=67255 RepID=A0ABU0Q3G1_STRAH|nr:hypothetical protein [Streptomyces achromogenes]
MPSTKGGRAFPGGSDLRTSSSVSWAEASYSTGTDVPGGQALAAALQVSRGFELPECSGDRGHACRAADAPRLSGRRANAEGRPSTGCGRTPLGVLQAGRRCYSAPSAPSAPSSGFSSASLTADSRPICSTSHLSNSMAARTQLTVEETNSSMLTPAPISSCASPMRRTVPSSWVCGVDLRPQGAAVPVVDRLEQLRLVVDLVGPVEERPHRVDRLVPLAAEHEVRTELLPRRREVTLVVDDVLQLHLVEELLHEVLIRDDGARRSTLGLRLWLAPEVRNRGRVDAHRDFPFVRILPSSPMRGGGWQAPPGLSALS